MGPFKCPDCGVWWAGSEHRCHAADLAPACQCPAIWHGVIPPWCPVHNPGPAVVTTTDSFTVTCTCPPGRGSHYGGTCPVHDVSVIYTT